jgi:hypothetical protein
VNWRSGDNWIASSRHARQARVTKNLLLRDFGHRSIFDFCNNIGAKRLSAKAQQKKPRTMPGL